MTNFKFQISNFKLKAIWLMFLVGVFLVSPTTAFAATLSLFPSSGTFNKGCSFTLNLELDTQGAQTDGTDAILVYDPSRLSATQILNGTIYSDYPGSNINSSAGKITVSGLASVSSAYSGKGTLASINFTVLDNAQTGATGITFDFDPQDRSKTTDSNVVERGTVADVLTSVTNGNYVVGSGSCVAQASPPPAGTTIISTPSGALQPGEKGGVPSLPAAGSQELTFTLIILGSILTILGILGLILL